MSANERMQEDLQQTKADFSQLKSEVDRKVAKAKLDIEVEQAKAKIAGQVENEAAKDEVVFRAASADAKAQYEKLQAQRAQLKSDISTNTGEAREKMQAALDRVESQIAASYDAMAEYYERRDAGEVGLN
jgi:chromosome segregation ATPase